MHLITSGNSPVNAEIENFLAFGVEPYCYSLINGNQSSEQSAFEKFFIFDVLH